MSQVDRYQAERLTYSADGMNAGSWLVGRINADRRMMVASPS